MPKEKKIILLDVLIVVASLYLALLLKFDFKIEVEYIKFFKLSILPVIIITILCNKIFNLYNNMWKYASAEEFLSVIYSVSISNIIFIIYSYLVTFTLIRSAYYRFPFTVLMIYWCVSIVGLGGIRFIFRANKLITRQGDKSKKINLLIIGAGDAGAMIMKEINKHSDLSYKIVGFIDDDEKKIGKQINNVKVLGGRENIVQICEENNVEQILISLPSVDADEKTEIINLCKKTKCKLKIIPGVYEIINGRVDINHIRDVKIEDLLGREEIKLNNENIRGLIEDKVVLVTGGGGSIGSELCRQIVKYSPTKLIILDIYENNAYDIQRELNFKYKDLDLEVVIASVRDLIRIREVFQKYHPNVVFHAAAHKHVPFMEENPTEAIKNNIVGTYNVASCCHEYKVNRVVLISTDKAVNPTNIMGASKRFCEMIIQAFDNFSNTEYVAVRFGNVLGSNGSVIPLFKKQIAQGGPITLTHPEITRFFMTIPEASQLVIQAGAMAKGGEIFVLDMGTPVKMLDLAKDLIRLSGFEPDKDIKIEYMGLRPGEKLYEELLMDELALTSTEHKKIFIEKPSDISFTYISKSIDEFKNILRKNDEELIFEIMEEKVPTYKRSNVGHEKIEEEKVITKEN